MDPVTVGAITGIAKNSTIKAGYKQNNAIKAGDGVTIELDNSKTITKTVDKSKAVESKPTEMVNVNSSRFANPQSEAPAQPANEKQAEDTGMEL